MTAGTAVQPIFWGSTWPTYTGDAMDGLDTFYSGVGASNYMRTNTEYTDGTGLHASAVVTTLARSVDGTAAPTSAPSTSAVLAEVAKQISTPIPNGYYPVYSDQPRGNAGYCAWHSWGSVHGVTVQFGFFFKLDGDAGCDPQDPGTTHSQGLEALANVSGHELSEVATDRWGTAWYDRQGYENADKCAWTFGGPVVLSNGSTWKIQGNWSNTAYTANTGYQRGCIDGN